MKQFSKPTRTPASSAVPFPPLHTSSLISFLFTPNRLLLTAIIMPLPPKRSTSPPIPSASWNRLLNLIIVLCAVLSLPMVLISLSRKSCRSSRNVSLKISKIQSSSLKPAIMTALFLTNASGSPVRNLSPAFPKQCSNPSPIPPLPLNRKSGALCPTSPATLSMSSAMMILPSSRTHPHRNPA